MARVPAPPCLKRPKDAGFRPVFVASHCVHSATAASRRAHLALLAHPLQRLPRLAHRFIVTPPARVKRASPEHLPASPLFTGISGHAWLKRPFHAGLRPTFIPRFAPVSARAVPIFYRTGAAAGATHSVASPQSKRRSRDSTRRIRRVKYRRLNPAAGSRRPTTTPATTPPQYPP